MKLFLTLLLLLSLAFAANPFWKVCSRPNAHIKVKEIDVTPNPPVIGQDISISFTGHLDETLNGGFGNFTVDWYRDNRWIDLYTASKKVCDEIACPQKSGTITHTTKVSIPDVTPHGKYRGELMAFDQNNQELICISFLVDLQ